MKLQARDTSMQNVNEAAFGKAIFEEIQMFNNEMKQLKDKAASLNINIGNSDLFFFKFRMYEILIKEHFGKGTFSKQF